MEKLHPKSQAALAAMAAGEPPPELVPGDPTKPASKEEREFWQKQNAYVEALIKTSAGIQSNEVDGIFKETELFRYPSEDGTYEIECRFYPAKAENGDKPPLVIYFHGGGMTLLSRDAISEIHVCNLIRELGCSVLTPEFRNARDHHFPAGVDDCLSTVKWAHSNRDILGFGDTVITAGASGGGNLAIATYIRALEKEIDAKALICGIYSDCPCIRPNYIGVKKLNDIFSPLIPPEVMQPICDNYTQSKEDFERASAWPLLASEEILKQFPPTCLRGEEFDILREDAKDFYALLMDLGVEGCTYAEKKNCFHGSCFLTGWYGEVDSFLGIAEISQFAKSLSSMKKILHNP